VHSIQGIEYQEPRKNEKIVWPVYIQCIWQIGGSDSILRDWGFTSSVFILFLEAS
jgi:hypothetical protein